MKLQLTLLTLCLSVLTLHAQTDTIIRVNVENEVVKRYLDEVVYAVGDSSRVTDYEIMPARNDSPRPAVVPVPVADVSGLKLFVSDDVAYANALVIEVEEGATEVAVYNLVPWQKYYFKLVAGDTILRRGEIHTEGQVRMINVPSISNVRDLGGWLVAGGRCIKYGRIYRGRELNGSHIADSVDLAVLTDQLDIGAELDMRAAYNQGNNVSAFGFLNAKEVGQDEVASYYYTSDSGQLVEHLTNYLYIYRWRREFNFIVDNLRAGRNIYIHCVWGANRTGYLALMMEGLLGVGYDGLVKDYELTTFCGQRLEKKEKIDGALEFFQNQEGNTLQEKFRNYFLKKLNVSKSNIDFFLSEMLTDTDSPIVTQVNSPSTQRMEKACFDLQGRKLPSGTKGLTIEIGSDGKARKVIR